MGWKGVVRSVAAASRAAERDAKRRQRELERQQKQFDKMQELEQAEYEVDVYNNHIDLIQSVHKECSSPVDWAATVSAAEPEKPEKICKHEEQAKDKLANYRPGLIDRLLKREEKKRNKLASDIDKASSKDEANYIGNIENWENEHNDWKESTDLARGVLSGEPESKLTAIKKLNPYSEISTIGSSLSFKIEENSTVEVTINIHGVDIVPSEVKSLLKSGRMSVKSMPKGKFNELYQDYVCSCVLRVANEIFSILPDELVFVTAIDRLLNTKTGHMEEAPILSVCVARKTLHGLNMDYIDPSDSMSNFVHNMSFKKTQGFEIVERIGPSCLQKRE